MPLAGQPLAAGFQSFTRKGRRVSPLNLRDSRDNSLPAANGWSKRLLTMNNLRTNYRQRTIDDELFKDGFLAMVAKQRAIDDE
jgi:hypothetical protein